MPARVPRPLLALLMFLALAPVAAPFAQAAAERVEIFETPLRVGDRLLYRVATTEQVTTPPGEAYEWDPARTVLYEGEHEFLVDVLGPTTAVNAYGQEVPANAFRAVRQRGDEVLESTMCYGNGLLVVRRDYLAGGPVSREQWNVQSGDLQLLGEAIAYTNTSPVTVFGGWPCGVTTHDGPVSYTNEVSRYPGPQIDAPEGFPDFGGANAPSSITLDSFHGRRALTFVHPLSNERLGERSDSRYGTGRVTSTGELRYTVAEGFPGAVRIAIHEERTFYEERRVLDGTLELIGFEVGDEPLPRHEPEWWTRNPAASYVAHDGLAVPTDLLDLPYPFAEAFAALKADARLGLSAWLAAHPDAGIDQALYDRYMDRREGVDAAMDVTDTDGGWYVSLSDGQEGFFATTLRHTSLGGPLGQLGLPTKVVTNDGSPMETSLMGLPKRYEAIAHEDVAGFLALAGIEPGTVESVFFTGSQNEYGTFANMRISQVPVWGAPAEGGQVGLTLDVDLVTGAMQGVTSTVRETERSGLMQTLSPPREVRSPNGPAQRLTFASLGIDPLAAAAAATGIALFVALLAKLVLIPMYTRLKRDRLLDNPVRAMLFERIRADPGIHLAEIEEFLGVGKGAARHHVDQLAKHRFVFLLEDGGYTRAYVTGHVPPDVARRSALLRAGSHQRIYDLYAAEPDLPLREAARRLGMSAPSVHRAKKKLEAAGLLPADGASPPSVAVRQG